MNAFLRVRDTGRNPPYYWEDDRPGLLCGGKAESAQLRLWSVRSVGVQDAARNRSSAVERGPVYSATG